MRCAGHGRGSVGGTLLGAGGAPGGPWRRRRVRTRTLDELQLGRDPAVLRRGYVDPVRATCAPPALGVLGRENGEVDALPGPDESGEQRDVRQR